MQEFTASIEGLDTLESTLTMLVRDTTRRVIESSFADLRDAVMLQFRTEGRAYSERWQPRKDPHDQTRPTLVRTGRLLRSLTVARDGEHIEQILAGPGSQLVGIFGTAVPYANPLQLGTSCGLPARPILTDGMLDQ